MVREKRGLPWWPADVSLLLLGGMILYVATLAPTVLWGDDAELQRLAATGGAVNPGRGHALWLLVARALRPACSSGDAARCANLVSALFGALTLPFVYAVILRLTGRRSAAILGAAALGVSHTFWLHAVRAEVYTLHTFLFAAVLVLVLRWADDPERLVSLSAAAFIAGVALLNHLLMLTIVPGLIALLWIRAGDAGAAVSRLRAFAAAGVAFLAGALPYLIFVVPAAVGDPFARPLSSFNPLSIGGGDLLRAALYIVYQFPICLPLAVPGLILLWRRRRSVALFLALVWAASAAFAVSFHVRDQYVFYLPSHVVLAIFTGCGASAVLEQIEARAASAKGALVPATLLLAIAFLVVPVGAYRAAPEIAEKTGASVIRPRDLPGRDMTFFLWPPKNGYLGARRFAEEALRVMPGGSVILADWSPAQTLLYMQEVEGVRRDVVVKQLGAGWSLQVPYLLRQIADHPTFLAGTDAYYDMEEIRVRFEVRPDGPVYRLQVRR